VRLTILAEAPAAYPSVQFDELSLLVRDTHLEVRQAATERLLATCPLMDLFPGVLEDRIPSEDDTALRQYLLAECLRAGGSRRLLTLTMRLAPDRSREILTLLIDKEERFSWEQLEPLSTRHEPRRNSLLIQLLNPESSVSALTWLLRAIAHAATWPTPGNREEREVARDVCLIAWHATQFVLASHAQLQAIDRVDFDRGSMQLVITHLGKEIVELESEREYDEEEPASYDEAINQRHALINTLSRMALVD